MIKIWKGKELSGNRNMHFGGCKISFGGSLTINIDKKIGVGVFLFFLYALLYIPTLAPQTTLFFYNRYMHRDTDLCGVDFLAAFMF